MENNSLLYRLPITSQMAPKAYISVLIMKGIDESNPYSDFRMSMATIQVDPGQQALSVEIIPDKQQASPGEEVQYTVNIKDASGRPVSAEVSLSLSDLAALSLAGPNAQPILDYSL